MIRSLTDVVWPTLERLGAAGRAAEDQATLRDVRSIEACAFEPSSTEALEEAKRLASDENDRRRGAEARASTYLLVIAALIPLLTYLENTVWGQAFGQAPRWLSLSVLAVAVLYLLGAGRWAFRTLRVGAYERIDASDLVTIWSSGAMSHAEALTKQILISTRRNRDGINEKVSGIKMTHAFLARAILWFGLLLLLQVAWFLGPAIASRVAVARAAICG